MPYYYSQKAQQLRKVAWGYLWIMFFASEEEAQQKLNRVQNYDDVTVSDDDKEVKDEKELAATFLSEWRTARTYPEYDCKVI